MNTNNQHWEAYEAKKSKLRAIADSLIKSEPYLIPVVEHKHRVTAAKNIRIELKRFFPGVKFSVTSETFSMGDAIRISWTGGPEARDVETTTNKYSTGKFDSMEDCAYDIETPWTVAFGSAKYVTTSRSRTSE